MFCIKYSEVRLEIIVVSLKVGRDFEVFNLSLGQSVQVLINRQPQDQSNDPETGSSFTVLSAKSSRSVILLLFTGKINI